MSAPACQFHITPRDVLFMRDARPMEASDAGLGANWPRPDQMWLAFIASFHARWPDHQVWEHQHTKGTGPEENPNSSDRFGGLQTAGPFPFDEKTGETYFPCPLDLSADEGGVLHPMRLVSAAGTDRPQPLTHAFLAACVGKEHLPTWISAQEYALYQAGKPFKPTPVTLYDSERRIGVAIDAGTQTAEDGKLYQAEYLRLRSSMETLTRMTVQISCPIIGTTKQATDLLAQIPAKEAITLVLGGQQGVAMATRTTQPFALPANVPVGTCTGPILLRWVLLSPAVFPALPANPAKGVPSHHGGWLPTWVDPESGRVMLPRADVPQKSGEARETWRQRVKAAPKFMAHLVAARIGKPQAFSGWDQKNGPKPTQLAVPAGSVYVFECSDAQEATDLIRALTWNGGSGQEIRNRRSTVFGERGFGLGVCAPYQDNNQPRT